SKGGACRRCCCREIMPTSAAGGSSSRWLAPPSAGPTCSPKRGPGARRGAHWMSSKPAPGVMLAQGPQVRPEEKIEGTDTSNIIQEIEKPRMTRETPDLKPVDTAAVQVKV